MQYKAYLPATFIKKFQFGSKKAIQSAMANANEMKNPSQKAKSKFSMRPRLKFDFGQTKLSSSQHEKENSVKNERTLDNAGDANNNLSSSPNEYVYL